MTPPSQTAALFLNQSATVAGDGGYSKVGTIEGWIQLISDKNAIVGVAPGQKPVRLWEDRQRLLTLTGITLTGKNDEFWVEFSSASGKLLFSGGGAVAVPFFADGQFHHFALTLDRNKGLSLGFDGKDPTTISTDEDDNIKADLLIRQLTIGHAKDRSGSEHPGFIGNIAGLHLWKKPLTPAEIRAAGNWHTSYCPTPDFKFKEIDPSKLLGFLNPEIPVFRFYYEPKGCWVMDGTESKEPTQAHLPDCDQHHHAVYESPRYFLTTREKATNKLYVINDTDHMNPLWLVPDQSRQFVFTTDDLILTFSFELLKLSPEGLDKYEAVTESFSIASKPDKALPNEFRPLPPYKSKCFRPTVLQPEDGLQQKLGDAFASQPKINFPMNLLGWNEKLMEDPFDSASTGANNPIFALPPMNTFDYRRRLNEVVVFGWNLKLSSFAEGTMHSSLVANGSDLRTAVTTSKSFKVSAKAGCAFVSGSASFNHNSTLGATEESMYNDETMQSQHTFFVTSHTMVLDKPNVRFDGHGSLKGFWPHIHDYAKGTRSGEEIFESYGTHYPHAICYGARGKAQHSYTKKGMSTLLQNCKKLGWGVEAKISANVAGFKGSVGGGYTQEEANDDMNKITGNKDVTQTEYKCIGSTVCDHNAAVHLSDHSVPVFVDLRPITEVLAPPFFDSYEMTVNVRRKLINDLMIYLPSEKTPSKVDVFHFLSLSFSRPLGFYQGRDSLNALPGAVFTCSSPVSVKVTGPSNRGKETPGGKETLLEFKTFSFGLEADSIKQAFCYSGNNTDNKAVVEFTLPNTWSFGRTVDMSAVRPVDHPPRVMKLEFALDDEKLLSAEGVARTFVLPTDVTHEGSGRPHPFVAKFPVVLRKLNLQDAFFNGLPAEWKEAEWKVVG